MLQSMGSQRVGHERATEMTDSEVALAAKNRPANAGEVRDTGSVPGSGRSPGGETGNPLQYSCLENPHGQRSLVGYSCRVGHD